MKIALVTGGNRGLGFEICRQLDAKGWSVILCARNPVSVPKQIGEMRNVTVFPLDVTSDASVHELFKFVQKKYDCIDVLINNAGVNETGWRMGLRNIVSRNKTLFRIAKGVKSMFIIPADVKSPQTNPENAKLVMDVNFYGPWRMILAFVPLLLKSTDARIINISSGMGQLRELDGNYPAYRMSKAGLNALTLMFSRQLENDGIKVNAVCPGWVRTAMGGPEAPLSVMEGADTPVWLATCENSPTGKFFKNRTIIEW